MLLESINSPADLKRLSLEQLPELATEIRQKIVEVVSATGGHLASSLGATELAIALHYCLDAPRDKIVWDVGHQSYAHKILTGRNMNFATLRQNQGISGFPCKEESECDPFTTGHSSTAISLALGLACARDYLGPDEHFKVVAVIGDGSLSGGLCFEGLNNAGHLKRNLCVVLNTNELSIAPNVGALSTYLNKLISLPIYNRFKWSLETFVKSRIPKGSRLIKISNKFEEGIKSFFIPGLFFEELGFRYFGPLDGHNIGLLISTLNNILCMKGPVLLHIITKKGKGYTPSESDPIRFHSAPPFEITTGKPKAKGSPDAKSYTEAFSEKLVELAQKNKKIIAITAAMPEGTGLDKFRDKFPDRFFDVGIAEEHAVCFASGLARQGLKPVVAVYSTFLQRAYDQIIECVALQKNGVIFAIDRAGLVGEDGVTHQGVFDIAFLRNIPNLVVMAPKDCEELQDMLEFATNSGEPMAIRYPKDKIPSIEYGARRTAIELGKAEVLREGKGAVIFALGSVVANSLKAAESLEKENINVGVVNSRFAKPLDRELLRALSARTQLIFTAEDGILGGGFGSAVTEVLDKPVVRIGIPAEFVSHAPRGVLLDKYGLSARGIAQKIKEALCPR